MKKMSNGGMADHKLKEHGIGPKNEARGFKKGGVTGKAMKAMGRNMARAKNQRGR